MKRLFLLTCFISLSVASSAQKTMAEYWEDVALSFAEIEPSFENSTCYKAERVFLACVHALTEAAALDGATLTTKDRIQNANPGFGTVKADFGQIVAVEPAALKDESPAVAYKARRDERNAIHQFWTRLYQNRAVAGEVDFTRLLAWFKGLPDFSKKEAVLTARIYNVYIGVLKDPHTMVLPMQYLQDEMQAGSDDFVGIGARFKLVKRGGKNLILLETPLEGSPALKAGLRPQDVLTHVDGVEVSGDDLSGALKKIKGQQGTTVTLTVDRAGKSLQILVARDLITQPNVAHKLLTNPNGDTVGYVKLSGFMKDKGCEEVGSAIKDSVTKGAKALVFDLRDNGGGLINQAVCIANLFLDKGQTVVSTKALATGKDTRLDTTEPRLTGLPLVTLINSRSASASEIVAGALQDHKRAWLVGDRTYGKGSVQQQSQLSARLAVRLTIARFYLPSGRTNQVEGVYPDFQAWSTPNPTDDEKVADREEDEYMALDPVGTPWQQPRAAQVGDINACLAKNGTAAKDFQTGQATAAVVPDYQVLVAQDVLGCVLAGPRAPTSSGFEIGNGFRNWQFLVPMFLNFNFAVPGIGVL